MSLNLKRKKAVINSLALVTALKLLFTSCGVPPSNTNQAIKLFESSVFAPKGSVLAAERFKKMHRLLKNSLTTKGAYSKEFVNFLPYLTVTELDSLSRFLNQWNKALNDSLLSVRSYPLEKSALKAAQDQLREQDFMDRVKLNNFFSGKIKKEAEKRKASSPPKHSRLLMKKSQSLARKNKEPKPTPFKGFGFKPRRTQYRPRA